MLKFQLALTKLYKKKQLKNHLGWSLGVPFSTSNNNNLQFSGSVFLANTRVNWALPNSIKHKSPVPLPFAEAFQNSKIRRFPNPLFLYYNSFKKELAFQSQQGYPILQLQENNNTLTSNNKPKKWQFFKVNWFSFLFIWLNGLSCTPPESRKICLLLLWEK